MATTNHSPLEIEIIDFFVQLSALLGQPRSFAEIYGLLFISPQPLAMDDLIERLELSKGSASQGLKFLREFGAVREVAIEGDRRTHYEAVAELRNLATRFMRDQISPHLERGQARLDRIAALASELPATERARVSGRVTMLQSCIPAITAPCIRSTPCSLPRAGWPAIATSCSRSSVAAVNSNAFKVKC